MRHLSSLLLAALLLALLASTASADPLNGSILISCNPASTGQVDPIVSWGVSPSDHIHAFFGSDHASASTTLPQMFAGGTSCDVKSDKSLYWVPAIVKPDGTIVYPTRSSFYYRAANRGVPITPFPPGLRFVSGNPNNLSRYTSAARWQCSGQPAQLSIPASCPTGGGVQETQYVSPCWDGLDLGPGGGGHAAITGTQHMANAPTGSDGRPHCPASHPINLPSLQFIINWPAAAPGGRLTSDDLGADPGASAHVDFYNGWTFNTQGHDAQSLLVDQCLNVPDNPPSTTCRVTSTGQIVTHPAGVYVTD